MSLDRVLDDAATQQPKLTPYVRPILSGQLWAKEVDGPWPTRGVSAVYSVRVLGFKDGWVRYFVNDLAPDCREREEIFRRIYKFVDEPEDMREDGLRDLRERFETWARNHGWKLDLRADGQYASNSTEYGWGAFVAGARGYCS